ncbi:MAG: hypothetical protein Q4F00_01400 [bacterium]|nr:hypothetical protein [bacterium]
MFLEVALRRRRIVKAIMRIHTDVNVFEILRELAADTYALLQRCSALAGTTWRVFVVGGLVRDALLGQVNRDIDIVVLEDAEGYARYLSDHLPGKLTVHEQFQTASIDVEGTVLDVVQARREIYAFPGALPKVFVSSLEDDLRRRDFTANSLAAILNDAGFGELAECGGYEDLQAGLVRIWHERSFTDDPTRIFRAVKYAVRCAWRLTADTEEALRNAVAAEALHTVSPARIGREIRLILREKQAVSCWDMLQKLGVASALGLPDGCWELVRERMLRAQEHTSEQHPLGVPLSEQERFQLFLNLLLSDCPEKAALQWLERWQFLAHEKEAYKRSRRAVSLQRTVQDNQRGRAERAYELVKIDAVSLLTLWYCSADAQASGLIAEYFEKWRALVPLVDGRFLLSLGINPGPLYKKILRLSWIAQAEGIISTHEEARAMILQQSGAAALLPLRSCPHTR